MRRPLWIVAVCALALGAAGCASEESDAESTTTLVETTTSIETTTSVVTTTTLEPDRSTTTTSVPEGPSRRTIRILAQVDGRSQLVLRGSQVGWAHLDWAAPGRHEGSDLPTTINGVEWFPVWPDTGDPALLHCDCDSDFFDQLDPPVPAEPVSVSVGVVLGRGLVCIEQLPTAENEWTLVVDFDDNVFAGPDDYEVNLTLEFGDLEQSDANGADCGTLRDA